jgi:hypothetical protein
MKHFTLLAFLLICLSGNYAAQILGCTSPYAPNYDPTATINDGTCTYDVPALLESGYCIQELLDGDVQWQDFRGINYQGGIIVDVSESEGKALICAESDLSVGINWGCYGDNVSGTSNAMYQGMNNTIAIVTASCIDSPNAATLCYQSTLNGYVDWILPTISELYTAYHCPNGPGGWEGTSSSDSYKYWSSVQLNSSIAWIWSVYFDSPTLDNYENSSTSSANVRPMRYVNISDACLTGGACDDWAYGGVDLQPENAGVACTYPLFECSAVGNGIWNSLVIGLYPATSSQLQYGLTWERDVIFNLPGEFEVDGNNYTVLAFEVNETSGLPDGMSSSIQAGDQVLANNQLCVGLEGIPLEEGAFTYTLTGTILLSVLNVPYSIENIALTHPILINPNTDGIPGCVYDFAGNYNSIATYDDGTCISGDAAICVGDLDGDEIIGVGDILSLLGLFGSTCN